MEIIDRRKNQIIGAALVVLAISVVIWAASWPEYYPAEELEEQCAIFTEKTGMSCEVQVKATVIVGGIK